MFPLANGLFVDTKRVCELLLGKTSFVPHRADASFQAVPPSYSAYLISVLIIVRNCCTVKGVYGIHQEIFSSRIRETRERLGLSAVELAVRVGLSKQAMREIESSRNGTTIERAAAFAKALDVSLDYLVGLSDDPMRR